MRTRRRQFRPLFGLVAVALSVLGAPVAAGAATKPAPKTVSFAALFSQPQNDELQERYRLYGPGTQVFNLETVRPGTIALLTNVPPNQNARIDMSPAAGQPRLKVGYYPATNGVGQPTFYADAGETGCDVPDAAVTIRDIGYDGKGFLNRLSMTFVEECEGYLPTLYGEIQFREPNSGPVVVAPGALSFGPTFVGTTGSAPIAVINTGKSPVRMLGDAVSGPGPFAITADHCVGAVLPAGGRCLISAAYRPTTGGAASATITIRDSSSVGSHVVALTGSGIGGLTGLSLTVTDGGVTAGSYQYSPQSGALMVYRANPQNLWVRAVTKTVIWDLNLTSALHGSIRPGDYLNVPGRDDANSNEMYFQVGGGLGGCEYSVSLVHIAKYTPAVGPLSGHIGIGFIQKCTNQGNNLVIFGSVNYDS